MAASTNATTLFLGTVWSRDTCIDRIHPLQVCGDILDSLRAC